MIIVNSEEELKKAILSELEKVIDYVMQEILIDGQKAISTVVYGAGKPKEYKRTYQFLNAWEEGVYQNNNGYDLMGAYFYSPDKLDPKHHESVIDGSDVREALAEIIYWGRAGKIFGNENSFWRQKRNAIDYLDKYVGSAQLNRYIKDGFKRYNIGYTGSFDISRIKGNWTI